ncbi:hypothetical protein ACA910_021939 [Epithemia clementina (nom. ined.)]
MFAFLSRLLDALFQSLGLGQKQGSLLLLGLDNAGKTTLLHRLRTGNLPQNFPPTDRPSQNEFQHNRIQFQAWDLGGHEVVRHLWTDYLMDATSDNRRKKMAILFLLDAADPERLEEAGFELDNLLIHNIVEQQQGEGQHSPSRTKGRSGNASNGSNNRRVMMGNDTSSAGGQGNPSSFSEDDDDNDDDQNNNNINNTSTTFNHENQLWFPPVAIMLNKCDLEDQVLSTEEICQRIDYSTLVQHYPSDRLAIFRISVLRGEGYQEAFQWIATFL